MKKFLLSLCALGSTMEGARTVLTEFLRDEAPAFIPCERRALDSAAITSPRKSPTSTLPASPPRAPGNWPRWMQASRTQPPTSFRNSRSSHEQDVGGGHSRPRYKCRRMSSFSTPFTVAIARRIAFSVPMRSGA